MSENIDFLSLKDLSKFSPSKFTKSGVFKTNNKDPKYKNGKKSSRALES